MSCRIESGHADGNYFRVYSATGALLVASSDKDFIALMCERHERAAP